MKRVIDTTVPFIAIREDVSGSPYDPFGASPLKPDIIEFNFGSGLQIVEGGLQ